MEIVPSGEGVTADKGSGGSGPDGEQCQYAKQLPADSQSSKEAVVETNAVFSCDSIRAVAAGPLPEPIQGNWIPSTCTESRIHTGGSRIHMTGIWW